MVEKIAEILYLNSGGVDENASEEEQLNCLGAVRESWDALPEWLRDDYRFQATKVLNFVNDLNKISEMDASMDDPQNQFEFRRNKKRIK